MKTLYVNGCSWTHGSELKNPVLPGATPNKV